MLTIDSQRHHRIIEAKSFDAHAKFKRDFKYFNDHLIKQSVREAYHETPDDRASDFLRQYQTVIQSISKQVYLPEPMKRALKKQQLALHLKKAAQL